MKWIVTVEYTVEAEDEAEATWLAQDGDWETSWVKSVREGENQ